MTWTEFLVLRISGQLMEFYFTFRTDISFDMPWNEKFLTALSKPQMCVGFEWDISIYRYIIFPKASNCQ